MDRNYWHEDDWHDYHNRRHKGTLRRSRHGILLGVCQGIADWSGINVGIIRVLTIIAFFASHFVPVGIVYLLMAIFLDTE
jgi:phage shock protein PspC (stress-responsive transcriptional regulator)